MIILTCKSCGNTDLRPARSFPDGYCTVCKKVLQLWEMKVVAHGSLESMMAAKQSERTTPNLTQNGV